MRQETVPQRTLSWWPLSLLYAVGALGLMLAVGSQVLAVIAAGAFFLVTVGLLYRVLGIGQVDAEQSLSHNTVPWGGTVEHQVRVRSRSRLRIPYAAVEMAAGLPGQPAGYVAELLADRPHRGESERDTAIVMTSPAIPCRTRGVFEIGPVTITMGDPLGQVRVVRAVAGSSRLVVLPRVVPLRSVALPTTSLLLGDAPGRRTLPSPPAAETIRPYQPGDPLRFVNWKKTAQRGEPFTTTFSPDEIDYALLIAVDLDGDLDAVTEETIVTIAASLLSYYASRSVPVGLAVSGTASLVLPPQRAQVGRLLPALAPAHAGPATLARQIARFRPAGQALVVLVTARAPELISGLLQAAARVGADCRAILVSPSGTTQGSPMPALGVPLAFGAVERTRDLIACLEGRGR
jgi:uncharacterized protein (DUF58 family)